MIAIIPAKTGSERVKNKNFRPFLDGKSLVDLTVEHLHRAGFSDSNIFLSTDQRPGGVKGCTHMYRIPGLCSNDAPVTDFIEKTCDQIDPDREHDIAWCQVINPMFTEYEQVLKMWDDVSSSHDSLCVIHPKKSYVLDCHKRPMGFGIAEGHIKSQDLPPHYHVTFTMSILSPEWRRYYIGRRPAYYHCRQPVCDIDTEQDFKIAQIVYRELNSKTPISL